MGNLRYIQKIKNNDKIILKQIILALCIAAMLAVLVGVVACLGNKRYIDLIWYFLALIGVIIIQYSTTFIGYTLIIDYDGGILRVSKSYSGKIKNVFEIAAKDLVVQEYSQNELRGEKIVLLVPKGCAKSGYVVKLSGKNYLVNFDDYMYSLIKVAHDIS